MNEELAALAASGATALVGAMGTDLWQEARGLVTRLLARARGSRGTELTTVLDRASTTTRGVVDARTVDYWTEVLSQLLHEHPEFASEVTALAALRVEERPDAMIQVNSATGSGEVFAVQRGSQHFASGPNSGTGHGERS